MLSLDNYFFPAINIQANPHFSPNGEDTSKNSSVDIKGTFSIGEDRRSCAAILDITVRAPDESTQVPYEIDITAVGSFSIPEGEETDNFSQLAPLFAFSVLYTSSREMILTLTSRGPWKRVMLPVHHFHADDLSERNSEDLAQGKRVLTRSRAKQKSSKG